MGCAAPMKDPGCRNILKPALSRGEIRCIGATTPSEYRKLHEGNAPSSAVQALKVDLRPPRRNDRDMMAQDRYEQFHQSIHARRDRGGVYIQSLSPIGSADKA